MSDIYVSGCVQKISDEDVHRVLSVLRREGQVSAVRLVNMMTQDGMQASKVRRVIQKEFDAGRVVRDRRLLLSEKVAPVAG